MLVEVAVSSINTSRAGSNRPCSRIQRRRARATSARSCSAARRLFFDADFVPLKEAPHRAAAAGDPSLAHRHDNFIECQIRLPSNQHKQKGRVRFQRRDATPARLRSNASRRLPALHPFDCRTRAHVEPPAASRRDAPDQRRPQLARVTPRSMASALMPSRIRINATRIAYPNLPGNPDSTQPKSALSVRNCWPTVCWINSLICVLWLAASKRVSSVIIQSETIGAVSGNASQPAIFPVISAWCIFGRTTSGTRKLRSTKEPSERPILSLLLGKMAVCGSGIPNGWRNRTVIANQSASPPIIPASAPARTR